MITLDLVYHNLRDGLAQASSERAHSQRRIGAELKFPLVKRDGTAADFPTVCALWGYLQQRGWEPVEDAVAGRVVGAKKPGEHNDTVASCETGFCKPEFALAHVADLAALEKSVEELRQELRPFSEQHQVHFLGYGIQPLTPPSKELMIKQSRTSVWDKAFGANRFLPPKDGDDVNLFTINAASHVHVSVASDEAIPAVNILNGFAGAQIALTANSNIWKGQVDPVYKCVNEKLWDWWMPDSTRVGMPSGPFEDSETTPATSAR